MFLHDLSFRCLHCGRPTRVHFEQLENILDEWPNIRLFTCLCRKQMVVDVRFNPQGRLVGTSYFQLKPSSKPHTSDLFRRVYLLRQVRKYLREEAEALLPKPGRLRQVICPSCQKVEAVDLSKFPPRVIHARLTYVCHNCGYQFSDSFDLPIGSQEAADFAIFLDEGVGRPNKPSLKDPDVADLKRSISLLGPCPPNGEIWG